jgi:cytochrome c553
MLPRRSAALVTAAKVVIPNLAGQKDRYMMKQLEKFQEGRRTDETMAPIAAQLSKKEVKALAKYFSKAGKVKINK